MFSHSRISCQHDIVVYRLPAASPLPGSATPAILKLGGEQDAGEVLGGAADAGIRFDDLRALLLSLQFTERVKGGHHIFARASVEELLNLQPRGSHAKPYQVKQVRNVILRYGLSKDIQQ